MLTEEYLMIRLMEELSELQHATSKCIRFGPKDVCKVHQIPNIEKVRHELEDSFAIISVLEHLGMEFRPDEERSKNKIQNVINDLTKAIERGIVDQPEGEEDVQD